MKVLWGLVFILISSMAMASPQLPMDFPFLKQWGYDQDPMTRNYVVDKVAGYPFQVQARGEVPLHVIHDGLSSLELRLQMVAMAKKSITFETFILDLDDSQRLFLQMLVKKAQEGVRVRLLIDHPPVYFFLTEKYVEALEEKGIEVKLYNSVSYFKLPRVHFRNHKKTLSVDGKLALIGGRNHGDSYFGLSHSYNYLDRDILIAGELVSHIDRTYELFWNHEFAAVPPHKKRKRLSKRPEKFEAWMEEARELLVTTEEDVERRIQVREKSEDHLASARQEFCPKAIYVSDLPGFAGKDINIVYDELMSRVKKVKKSLKLDTPYFVQQKKDRATLVNLLKKGKRIELFINSYAKVSDSFLTLNYFNAVSPFWAGVNLAVWATTGKKPNRYVAFDSAAAGARWGNHSKSYIFDDEDFIVSSYNFDPRSKMYSTESALACEGSDSLVQSMVDEFEKAKDEGVKLDSNGRPPGGHLEGLSFWRKILYHLQTPFAFLFKVYI